MHEKNYNIISHCERIVVADTPEEAIELVKFKGWSWDDVIDHEMNEEIYPVMEYEY